MNTLKDKSALKQYILPDHDTALLAECTVTTFRSHGKGGQYVNKTDSAVRIRHIRSGIVVTCQRERSQYLNKKNCIEKLRHKLEGLMEVMPPRIPTVIPEQERTKRKVDKIAQSQKKTMRKIPLLE